MKRILALLLVAVMALGMLSACGKEPINEGTPTYNYENEEIKKPETAGTLVVTAAASVQVSYGTDGLVLGLEGLNRDGIDLVAYYAEELFGSSCTDVVNQIIKDCVQRNYMFDTNYVVVKQNKGSALPGTSFLESVQSAAQRALDTVESDAPLVMITEENLTADGYIDLVTADLLVRRFLGVEELVSIDGTISPVDGMYAFDVAYGIMMEKVVVDAQTGVVAQGVIEEIEQLEDQEEMDRTATDETPSLDTESEDETDSDEN